MEDLSSSWKCTNACVPTKPQRALCIYYMYSMKFWWWKHLPTTDIM